jgi:hypothetical protein
MSHVRPETAADQAKRTCRGNREPPQALACDSLHIRHVVCIFELGQAVLTHYPVDLGLCLGLDFRVDEHGKEERHDGGHSGVAPGKIGDRGDVFDGLGLRLLCWQSRILFQHEVDHRRESSPVCLKGHGQKVDYRYGVEKG